MRKYLLPILFGLPACVWAENIDMQAPIGTDEAHEAYTDYVEAQANYYDMQLLEAEGDDLFGNLNSLMGETCRLRSGFSYNTLRDYYVSVDRDLNTAGNIIGYYDGRTMNGKWDSGKTYNREHTWPQSKGADKGICMGYDMQSVRPTSTKVNGERGNTAYGESNGYYDPSTVAIYNQDYRSENQGTYRGDAARVILYDYLVYGHRGGHQSAMHNGKAQLLEKLGADGVFESLAVLVKWHMQDPPSLTEMVRNDGAEVYQGNRNPFIDFPTVAIDILKQDLEDAGSKVYTVGVAGDLVAEPNYHYTLSDGFVCYLSDANGFRVQKADLEVEGADYTYDEQMGRLTLKNVQNGVVIRQNMETRTEQNTVRHAARKRLQNGQIVIEKNGAIYNLWGQSR